MAYTFCKIMKTTITQIKSYLILAFSAATLATSHADEKITVGSRYDLTGEADLRVGPSQNDQRIVNQKASDLLKEIHYMSVDSSTTVKVTEIKGDWVKIEVVEPEHLAATHRGWIPLKTIKIGNASQKKEGWIRHTALVYTSKDPKLKPIGYLAQPASVGVAADGSGWLRLIHGPVRDVNTKKFLTLEQTPKEIYIEEKNFTDVIPAKWQK
jgi:sRNA-binding carbon storage regulator CsrA